MSAVTITDEELNSLTNAILRRYDIDFTCYEPTSLKRRVVRSINVLQMGSVHELWVRLLKDRSFIYPFIDEISVGLTSMFRDPILWRSLKSEVLETLRHKEHVNIWHAGCSTGEEVYTMGIVLQEVGLLNKTRGVATDISEAAISVARSGSYHELKIAEYGRNYLEYNPTGLFQRYHETVDRTPKMKSSLIQHVDFRMHNLITEAPPEKFDIIFCRNVMIYFDHKSKVRLLQQFHDHLNEGGYLIIGFYDALIPLIDKEKYQIASMESKIFQKKKAIPALQVPLSH